MELSDWENFSIPVLNKKIKGLEYLFIIGYATSNIFFGIFIFFGLKFDPLFAFLSFGMMFGFSTLCLFIVLFYLKLIVFLKELTK